MWSSFNPLGTSGGHSSPPSSQGKIVGVCTHYWSQLEAAGEDTLSSVALLACHGHWPAGLTFRQRDADADTWKPGVHHNRKGKKYSYSDTWQAAHL